MKTSSTMKFTWICLVLIETFTLITALNIIELVGNYSVPNEVKVNATNQYVLVFPPVATMNPYRVITTSRLARKNTPVLVVVRQEKQVTSWQLPMIVDTTKKNSIMRFTNASRTMCHDDMEDIVNPPEFNTGPLKLNQSFIIEISTACPQTIDVTVTLIQEVDFYVQLNQDYAKTISPSEPSFVYFRFDKNASDTVIILVNSGDDICFTVSVQDSKCPVLDTNKDITYEGYYQTVTTKGALTINKKRFKNGFFLVFVAKPDNYDCGQEKSVLPVPKSFLMVFNNRTSQLQFSIRNSISNKEYFEASFATLGALAVFALVSLIMTVLFSKWGKISEMRKEGFDAVLDSTSIDQNIPQSAPQIDYILKSDTLKLKNLAQYPMKDKRRSFNYLWHILSIAIFYSIPVVQLVVTYQRNVNLTGNQDMCYYNSLCAHPKFGVSDFNHVFSNVGYVVMGVIFILNTLHRHVKVPLRFEIGIPVHYGLFYAMGVALIIEGLLSASYHMCPTQSNYQFDTSFMYVMAVLCMVKLYQNRHPDINASAYATFSVLGLAIFLAMVGILNGTLGVWIAFVVMYSILCIYISFKIYFLSFILQGFEKFKNDFVDRGFKKENFAPNKKGRFILLVVVNLLNYAMLITGLVLYNTGVTDFGTFLLGLLMGNSVIHAIFYTSMKLLHKEKICKEAICYGLLGIASWAAATVFFLDPATLWTVTAAESREWNQDCILMNFYDKHDVWHLLSAPALYFTFMFLICLDDDLINTKQSEIEVF